MNEPKQFTTEEKELAENIIAYNFRNIAKELPFLQKPIFSLKLEASSELTSICSDYSKLYFNPVKIIELYRKNKKRIYEMIVHSVLHCLFLHPSMVSAHDEFFDAAANAAVNCMMIKANVFTAPMSVFMKSEQLIQKVGSTAATDMLSAAEKDAEVRQLVTIVGSIDLDDHCMWYKKEEKPDDKGKGRNDKEKGIEKEMSEAAADLVNGPDAQSEWSAMLSEAMAIAKREFNYGNIHGDMFDNVKKPDRFSKMSYREYIKKFAMSEIISEDPETIDPIMYSWGMEHLQDIPIIEFSETKEHSVVSDIIIAIDMSGSCSGEIAANFLRQLYTLFDEMEIRSTVNINVITFDTEIMDNFIVRSKNDADKFLSNYGGQGWGGTDFNCVFNYADMYSSNNCGKKLKGLFFFSDGMGSFPFEKPSYRTTFFVPVDKGSAPFFCFDPVSVPEWVELVKYDDN